MATTSKKTKSRRSSTSSATWFARETLGDPLRVVDLFAGAGGLSEGFRQAGFQILAGVDNDPDAAATYSLNFPEAKTIAGDIRSPAIRVRLREALRDADVIVGGPPCQAFSQVRNHSRVIDDPRNSLYREFVAAIQMARPLAFLMENVTGMDQLGVREQIAADLSLNGAYVVRPQVHDAADFGVPQTRKRLLFFGVRSDISDEAPVLVGSGATEAIALIRRASSKTAKYAIRAEESLFKPGVLKRLRDPHDDSVVSACDALSDLIDLPAGNRNDELPLVALPNCRSAYQMKMRAGLGTALTNVQVPRIREDTVLRLQGIPQGGNHRDLADDLLERYLTDTKWGQSNGSGRLSRKHFYAYRRLHPEIWAWTLNTKADSVYHYGPARSLSVREFARLQSFPDRFVFTTDPERGSLPGRHEGGSAHSRYRQVGNAVPPLLARAAATELLRTIRGQRFGLVPKRGAL